MSNARVKAAGPGAAACGIDVKRTNALTFAFGSGLAGAAGVVHGLYYGNTTFSLGFQSGLKAFTAAVLGGIGNIPGAALGGLLLGVVETFVNGSQWSTYKDAIAFAILIVITLLVNMLARYIVERRRDFSGAN